LIAQNTLLLSALAFRTSDLQVATP